MKTIEDLKTYLSEVSESLENDFEGYELLKIKTNTYFCGATFLATGSGFLDMGDLVDEEEEEEEEN